MGVSHCWPVALGVVRRPPLPSSLARTVVATALACEGDAAPTNGAAWTQGFIVNVLNPKAALFFISLYALRVSPATPALLKIGYGVWLMVATMAWFCLVSVLFTQTKVRRRFLRHGHWIDRALGVVFLAFAAALVLAKLS